MPRKAAFYGFYCNAAHDNCQDSERAALQKHPLHFRTGIMELPDDDPSEYHSLYEALAANGISTEGLPTWVPRDYAVSAIAVKLSDGVLKCSAIYDSTRGGLVIRVIEHTMALSTEAKELDSVGSVYTHNQTEYYILMDDGVTKAGWQDGMLSYVISGQISEAEIKEMINSIQ